MEEERRLIVWNTSALDRFADELKRLSASSYAKAERVEAAVLSGLQQAVTMPERYAKTSTSATIRGTTGLLKPTITGYPTVTTKSRSGSYASDTSGRNPSTTNNPLPRSAPLAHEPKHKAIAQ